MVHILSVRLDIDGTGFTDSSHWHRCAYHVMIMNMLQHSIHFCGFLILVGLLLMPNVLQGAWWSQSWHHVVPLANNCWTRSFALGYWLFYFSSVFDSNEKKKTFTGKRLSQVSVYDALFTLALIRDSQFLWQLVIILCQTNLLLDQSWWGTWY